MKFLYHFWLGERHWHFTSARKAVTFDDVTYYPIRGLQHSDIEDSGIEKCDIDITLPQPHLLLNEHDENLAQIFVNKIYYQGVKIEILELENVPLFNFRGRVVIPKFDDDNDTMTLNCSTHDSDFKRTIFTQKFQRTCPNSIYDLFCGLKVEDWAFEAEITSVSGTSFTFQPTDENYVMSTGYLDSGLLIKGAVYTWLRTAGSMYREHFGLKAGDIVLLAPGCNQSREMCHEKFNNHERFQGHVSIPNEDVTSSQIIK